MLINTYKQYVKNLLSKQKKLYLLEFLTFTRSIEYTRENFLHSNSEYFRYISGEFLYTLVRFNLIRKKRTTLNKKNIKN